MEHTNENVNNLKIKMDSPLAFEPVGDIKITSTNELGKCINDVFSKCFDDYHGCSIQAQFIPDRGYILVPKLYFTVLKKSDYERNNVFAFKTLDSQPSSDIVGRVMRLSQVSNSGVKISITNDAISVLEDFIITPNSRNAKFDWNSAYNVIATTTETYIELYKIDILKIITFLYGAKDANGSNQYYQITPTGVIGGQNQYKKMDNWSINIIRLNHNNEAKAAELLGCGSIIAQAGPAIITDKTTK